MSNSMMYTAVTGIDTFGTALSVVSDNVANANTTGWKSGTVDFGDLVSGYFATYSADTKAEGAGSTLLSITSDFSTGSTVQTGTWSNCMIQGNGFFNLLGANGSTYYTRDGSFRIDAAGYLTDMRDNQVIGAGGTPIQIENPAGVPYPKYTNYQIDKLGNVSGTDVTTGLSTNVGQIRVTTFPNPDGLIRQGANLYVPGASAGAAINGTAGSGQDGSITSGALEGSNVDLSKQMVDMIIYQADYQANSKAIETGNTLLQTVVNLIR